MHVLQVEAVADIVHTLPVMIVMKTFCSDYLVNSKFLGFCPLLHQLFLLGIYFPVCWAACLAS